MVIKSRVRLQLPPNSKHMDVGFIDASYLKSAWIG